MDDGVAIVVAFVGIGLFVVLIFLGSYISKEKGRDPSEGGCLAALLGPFGLLIAALLPNKISSGNQGTSPPASTQTAARPQQTPSQSAADAQAYQDQLRREREAYRKQVEALEEADRQRRAERAAARAARKARRDKWFRARGVEPGPMAWYWVQPDWVQAALVGLLIALPVVIVVIAALGR